MEDRISSLPQELVVSILSCLTIREAVMTSVLSHRWEKLWTFFNGSLSFNFDDIFPVDYLDLLDENEMQLLEQERHQYVGRVNQVLTSLDESSIPHEFSVCFDLDKDYSGHIDRWIEFVMEKKRVPRVQFDFTPFLSALGDRNMRYTFPHDCYVRLKQPGGLYSISALTSLCLKFVNVSGELIEHFLSNCPLLERLCVGGSEQLLNLKVIGATLQLKYLEIFQCYSLECVKISAPNLVSFNYFGRKKIELHFENVPQLVEVSLGSGYGGGGSIAYLMYFLSSYHSQLETLKLFIDFEVEKEFPQFLQFNKLKHLTLSVYASSKDSLLEWTSLIKASPVLHKFTLELMTANRSRGWIMRDVMDCPHPCLKVVEVVGFVGYATDIELIMYFFANAITLEKIIIDARHPSDFGTPREFRLSKKKREAKARALIMRGNLPPGVDVVIV